MGRDHFRHPVAWQPLALPGTGRWHVWRVAETGSTNADLLAAAAGGAPDRSVLTADHQTAGRGRLDRRWDAPPGANLLVSLLFRDVPDDPGALSRRVALAALEAVERCGGGAGAMLKWPNDVLLGGRKLAGLLAQMASDVGAVVVGIGINVGWSPEGAADLGGACTPHELLAAMLHAYDELPESAVEIGGRYRSRLDTIGRQVRVELPGEELVGRAVDVDGEGRLVVIDECAITHRIDVGDVVHVRAVPEHGVG